MLLGREQAVAAARRPAASQRRACASAQDASSPAGRPAGPSARPRSRAGALELGHAARAGRVGDDDAADALDDA